MSTFGAINPSAQGTTVGQVSIGSRHEDAYGRVFYYAFAATAVGRGKVARAAAAIAGHDNMSFQTAPAVGDRSVKVTLDGDALTADQYKDGWLVNQDGTGEGRLYRIEGCDAQTSTTGTAVIYLAEPIDIVMAVSEVNVDLVYNNYDELLPPADAGQDYLPVGVPMMVGGLGDCGDAIDERDPGHEVLESEGVVSGEALERDLDVGHEHLVNFVEDHRIEWKRFLR